MNDPTSPSPAAASTDLLAVGHRVEFTGYRAASFEYANIRIGETGTIESVKQPGQIGMDYAVKFDGGKRSMLNHNEVKRLPA